ncbi:MAG: DUF4340 domain-containing protein [Proteobacteria bacterium]|nr:DUF4340 domain-containing protein [Pseudomonadota bacterium]MBU4469464.1 DUF4340 domain-containing protein [Pseudomonadota bacterium]MCG2752365.1 DUF4340 domain-containing protein [Desulfobacteraceae bacterium]
MKKEYLVLVALILGLSAYLFFRDSDKIEYELPEVPHMAKNTITRIEMIKGDKTLVVIKEDGKWVTGEKHYAADANKVEAMLKAIEDFNLTAMVSEAKDYGRYNLSDDTKITVKAKDKDGKSLEIDLGKPAGTHRHSFVKLPGDPRVFHGSGNFQEVFDLEADAIRDKVVLQFNPEEITGISLKNKEKSLVLTLKTVAEKEEIKAQAEEKPIEGKAVKEKDLSEKKETKKWEAAEGEAVNEPEIKALISELANLRCETFISDKTREDFKSPRFEIELNGINNYSVALFDPQSKEAETFSGISSASPEPFVLPKWVAEKIMPEFSKLLKTAKD